MLVSGCFLLMGCCLKTWSHDTTCLFYHGNKGTNTQNSAPRKQTEKGFTCPSLHVLFLYVSLSLCLSLSFPLHARFITSFILLPHLTTFSSCCCNFVLWSIYIFLHCTCVHSNVLSWWTTITIVSNFFFCCYWYYVIWNLAAVTSDKW